MRLPLPAPTTATGVWLADSDENAAPRPGYQEHDYEQTRSTLHERRFGMCLPGTVGGGTPPRTGRRIRTADKDLTVAERGVLALGASQQPCRI